MECPQPCSIGPSPSSRMRRRFCCDGSPPRNIRRRGPSCECRTTPRPPARHSRTTNASCSARACVLPVMPRFVLLSLTPPFNPFGMPRRHQLPVEFSFQYFYQNLLRGFPQNLWWSFWFKFLSNLFFKFPAVLLMLQRLRKQITISLLSDKILRQQCSIFP